MKRNLLIATGFLAVLVGLGIGQGMFSKAAAQAAGTVMAPKFEVDPTWPKAIPNGWQLGQTIGVAVDARERVVQNLAKEVLDDRVRHLEIAGIKDDPRRVAVVEFDRDETAIRHAGSASMARTWSTKSWKSKRPS